VVRITVEAAYLHCAKVFLRSRSWRDEAREQMEQRYKPDL